MSNSKPTILVQLDTDAQPSVFDGVVAVDAGVDHLFRHAGVTPDNVRDLVYGALFTRGPADLHQTALFVGGSNVAAGEAVLETIKKTFFGPFRVSVLFDANGSNTTAAAAALAALTSVGGSLDGAHAVVLPATGPVGQRVARLLSRLGASVSIGSRDLGRAQSIAERLRTTTGGRFEAFTTGDPGQLDAAIAKASVVVAAGPEGAQVLPAALWQGRSDLRVVVDLNAVPPLGVEGIEAIDKNVERQGVRAWGALGVGGLKMKIHKKAVKALFNANDTILDAEEVLELGRDLV
ncbi:MAG: methylenetetrahydromethanopterin dehydrogenase [Paludisphaera borealis]|uniref:NAD(P)-dependent methylenetetrahydromethanopterin dehydrogenase n=1 Tax=Paludisphaera borealis TaxID=1387353 RepID=UPI00284C35DC|nr:methylenetetrahydromethanopterin dehydrogenase [Paludisphaera borealis]MDR3619200.1 methylenetetrahydromethanopterin dehydrogenase [Paludisphaera borealis]